MGNRSANFGNALCQHVPKTAATQGCPAAGQAAVCVVLPSPVLHHIHWGDKEEEKQEDQEKQKGTNRRQK